MLKTSGKILDGFKVVSLETSVSGPFCSVLLADFGAEVIKVEIPGKGDISRHWDTVARGFSSYFVYLNRNKKSVALDLKSQEGKNRLLRLIREADVFIENYRPNSIERLGLTYEELKKINPRLIYCGISGYGGDGPYRDQAAYDLLIQAESGLMSVTGTQEHPAKIGISVCDITTGLYSALAILLALLQREKSGEGVEIDISMFESALSLLIAYPMYYWYGNRKPGRQGMKHSLIAPAGAYLTKDGKYVMMAAEQEDEWKRLCVNVLGTPELASDARFATNENRLSNRAELEKLIEERTATQTREYWIEKLKSSGIPYARLNEIDEVINHPQVLSRKFISEIETERGPVKFFGNPIRIKGLHVLLNPPPRLGQDNERLKLEP